MNYRVKDLTRQVGTDGPKYAIKGQRSRDWYRAEFGRLAGLRDLDTAYALLQEAKKAHGDVWACATHYEATRHLMRD